LWRQRPTWSPARTPRAASACASRLARASRSTKRARWAPATSAVRSGTASTRLSKRSARFHSMLGPFAADDPHGEELRRAAVRVAERDAGAVDLVRAGPAAHLQRGLGEAEHAGGADGVGAEHAARRVDRQRAAHGGGAVEDRAPAARRQ